MQRLREFYALFFSHAKEGVWVAEIVPPLPLGLVPQKQIQWIAHHTVIRSCNDSFAQGHGFPNARVIHDMDFSKMFAWFDEENIRCLREFVTNHYAVEQALFRSIDASGRSRYFRGKLIGVVEKNHLVRIWGTQKDVTVRKQQELSRQIFLEKLTSKQRNVLELTMRGYSLKEIAESMAVSTKTVSTVRQRLLRKIGVRDLAGLFSSDIIAEMRKRLPGPQRTVKEKEH